MRKLKPNSKWIVWCMFGFMGGCQQMDPAMEFMHDADTGPSESEVSTISQVAQASVSVCREDDAGNIGIVEIPQSDLETALESGDWLPLTVYPDGDGDGAGANGSGETACEVSAGFVDISGDCNDADARLTPFDEDDDGVSTCDGDCDDTNSSVYPGAPELCDGIDNNCDGDTEDELGDMDFDQIINCEDPDADGDQIAAADGDCNDLDPTIHPYATETCNGLDDDCDGEIDDVINTDLNEDADGDGFGAPYTFYTGCETAPAGYVSNHDDCDDTEPTTNPAAEELCDGIDNNCNGAVDDGLSDMDYDGTPDCRDDDVDGDQITAADGDCDDSDPTIHPYASETCNCIDDNCDGVVDDAFQPDWHPDNDGDGYGNPSLAYIGCDLPPPGYVKNGDDCWDGSADFRPGAEEICDGYDNDCDGVVDDLPGGHGGTSPCTDDDGDGASEQEGDCDDRDPALNLDDADLDGYTSCDGDCDDQDASLNLDDRDEDGFTNCDGDCDDQDASTHPGAPERCDGIDNNCDGSIAEESGDVDADGLANCDDPDADGDQIAAADGDCNDLDAAIHPFATEICDGRDNDCDGIADNAVNSNLHLDADADGYGLPYTYYVGCESNPVGYADNFDDCDDADPNIHPDARELCDAIDNDCDGAIDDGLDDMDYDGTPDCRDSDADGDQITSDEGDCNDLNPQIHPQASEVCNCLDDNCDGTIDDVFQGDLHPDNDGDGFGNPSLAYIGCETDPEGYVRNGDDCWDGSDAVYPGAVEVCDGLDNDCNGITDDGCQ